MITCCGVHCKCGLNLMFLVQMLQHIKFWVPKMPTPQRPGTISQLIFHTRDIFLHLQHSNSEYCLILALLLEILTPQVLFLKSWPYYKTHCYCLSCIKYQLHTKVEPLLTASLRGVGILGDPILLELICRSSRQPRLLPLGLAKINKQRWAVDRPYKPFLLSAALPC